MVLNVPTINNYVKP